MAFRELFKEVMCAVCEKINYAMFMKIFLSGWKQTNVASLHMIFRELFKDVMCTACERLNAVDEYRYVYEDITQWKEANQRCITPYGILRVVKESLFAVCKGLNSVNEYSYVYEDISQWKEANQRCITLYTI